MDAFITRKKRKPSLTSGGLELGDDEPTEVKLAILSSLHPNLGQEALLDVLLAHDGSVQAASTSLLVSDPKKSFASPSSKKNVTVGSQTSLRTFTTGNSPQDGESPLPKKAKLLSRKGATLHLYDPVDIAEHTPCSIVHNFLPPDIANLLLRELLDESKSYEKITFKLFDNVVSSPHTSSFYVESMDEMERQKYEVGKAVPAS